MFDWDDDSTSEWIGPFASGEQVEMQHSWENKGSYQIIVKAKDEYGKQSDWSEPLEVRLTRNKFYFISMLNSLKYMRRFQFHKLPQNQSCKK